MQTLQNEVQQKQVIGGCADCLQAARNEVPAGGLSAPNPIGYYDTLSLSRLMSLMGPTIPWPLPDPIRWGVS